MSKNRDRCSVERGVMEGFDFILSRCTPESLIVLVLLAVLLDVRRFNIPLCPPFVAWPIDRPKADEKLQRVRREKSPP